MKQTLCRHCEGSFEEDSDNECECIFCDTCDRVMVVQQRMQEQTIALMPSDEGETCQECAQ